MALDEGQLQQPDDDVDPLTGIPRGQISTQPLPKVIDPGTGAPGIPGVNTDASGNVVSAQGPAGGTTPSTGVPAVPDVSAFPNSASKLAQSNPYASGDVRSAIESLYDQYHIKDGGRGSGFADEAYWAEHPSEVFNGRLGRDLAGTGTDNPEGTPGVGPWLNSGRNQPSAGGGQTSTATPFWAQQTPLPSFFGGQQPTQSVDTSSLTDSPAIRNLILSLLSTGGARG
jgi:hypothetical protein